MERKNLNKLNIIILMGLMILSTVLVFILMNNNASLETYGFDKKMEMAESDFEWVMNVNGFNSKNYTITKVVEKKNVFLVIRKCIYDREIGFDTYLSNGILNLEIDANTFENFEIEEASLNKCRFE